MALRRRRRIPPALKPVFWTATMVLGVAMMGFGAGDLHDAWRLWTEGEPRAAAVVNKRIETSRRSGSGFSLDRRRETYVVAYRLESANGERALPLRRDQVSEGFYQSVETGDRVDARVTPGATGLSEIEPGRTLFLALRQVGAGLVIAGASLLFLLTRRRK